MGLLVGLELVALELGLERGLELGLELRLVWVLELVLAPWVVQVLPLESLALKLLVI